jgi:hypothetical protein
MSCAGLNEKDKVLPCSEQVINGSMLVGFVQVTVVIGKTVPSFVWIVAVTDVVALL